VKVRGADNGELRSVLRQFLLVFDLHEQVAGEEVLPGLGGDDADGQAVGRVSPGVTVLHKDFFALEEGQQPVVEQVEFFYLQGLVLRPPGDVMGAGRLLDDKLVPGRPAGINPGPHHDGAQMGDESLAPGDDLLIEGGGGQIPMNRLHIAGATP